MDRYPVLFSFVRITAENKAIRAKVNSSSEATFTLTEGVYWLGAGALGGQTDSTIVPGASSLLAHLESVLSPWTFRVQVQGIDGITESPTGHVWMDPNNGNTNEILWGHADTTVDPRWFGRAPVGDTFTTWASSANDWQDLSDYSSSLVFAGDVEVYRDDYGEEPIESALYAGTGRQSSRYYGTREALELLFAVDGLQRGEIDNTYHAARRFLREQSFHRSLGFLYFPDTSVSSYPLAHNIDDSQEANRFGYKRYTIDAGQRPNWRPVERYPGYANHHTAALSCREHKGDAAAASAEELTQVGTIINCTITRPTVSTIKIEPTNTKNPGLVLMFDSAKSPSLVEIPTAGITFDITTTGLNGLRTGTEATNTNYDLFLVYNGTTPRWIAEVAGTDLTFENLSAAASGYDRMTGVVTCASNSQNSGADLMDFVQTNNRCRLMNFTDAAIISGNTSGAATYTAADISLYAPSTVCCAAMRVEMATGTTAVYVSAYQDNAGANLMGSTHTMDNASGFSRNGAQVWPISATGNPTSAWCYFRNSAVPDSSGLYVYLLEWEV